jgi:hypothetical protein
VARAALATVFNELRILTSKDLEGLPRTLRGQVFFDAGLLSMPRSATHDDALESER